MTEFSIELPVLWYTPEQAQELEEAEIIAEATGKEISMEVDDVELARAFRKRQTFYIIESTTKAYDTKTGVTSERFSILYSGGKPYYIGWPYHKLNEEISRRVQELLNREM